MADKQFYIESGEFLDIKSSKPDDLNKNLRITGYANTVDKDRVGDVIKPQAWAKGIADYRRNPILLYQHDHSKPIGRVENIKVDQKGIKVDGIISSAAEKQHSVQTLIQDGVLKSFSVGFRIKNAEYDKDTETFLIDEVELMEISVVSIPANQHSLFSIRKSFDNDDEFTQFKSSVIKEKEDIMDIETKDDVSEEDILAMVPDVNGMEEETEEHTLSVEELPSHDLTAPEESTHKHEVIEASSETTITEEEEDEEITSDPYEQIPFTNLLSAEVNEIKEGDFVVYSGSRYKVSSTATTEDPTLSFTPVDVMGRESGDGAVVKELSTALAVVNPWESNTEFDLHLIKLDDESVVLTDSARNSIKQNFEQNVLSNAPELVKMKSSVNDLRIQKILNDLINLKIYSDWSDSHYELANKYNNVIERLQELPQDDNVKQELKLYGISDDTENNEIQENELKEKEDMATQDVGDPIEINTKSETTAETPAVRTEVAEPEVAKLVEKTGAAILDDSSNKDLADIHGGTRDHALAEEVAELRGQLSAYKDQVNGLQTSKMQYNENTSRSNAPTRKEMADAYFLGAALNTAPENTKYGKEISEKAVISGSSSNSPLQMAFSEDIYHEMQQQLVIAPMFNRIGVNQKSFNIPVASEDTDEAVAQFASGTYVTGPTDSTNVADDKQHGLTSVELTPHKFMASTYIAKDEEEDTILPLLDFLRAAATRRMARFIDKVLLRGTGGGSGFANSAGLTAGTGVVSPITGIVNHSAAVSGLITYTGGASNKANAQTIADARSTMGKYGLALGENLVYLTTIEGYNSLVQTSDFQTIDKFGPQATYLTGSLGAVYGIPIVITEFLDNSGTANNDIGLLMYKPGFLIGERRSVEVESEYLPRQQVTAMYISTRLDMQALTTETNAALSSTYSFASVVRSGAAS